MAEAPSHPAHALLARAQPPDQAATFFKEKIQHRPLILRPTSPDPSSRDARGGRRRERLHRNAYQLRKQKPRRLSAKERRRLGVHEIPSSPELRKWKLYVPLRRLWWGYMQELLGIASSDSDRTQRTWGKYVTGASVGPKLTSADFHGAELEVVRSKCVGRVGVRGIVLKDTKYTFEIVTKGNEIKTVPKCQTVFRFEVPRCSLSPMPTETQSAVEAVEELLPQPQLKPFVFDIHGEQFELRAVDRANKKFKPKSLDNL